MANGLAILRLNLDDDYLQKKFLAYRIQTSLIILLTALMGMSEWLIDYKLDPAAARHLAWLRLSYVWLAIPAWCIWRTDSHRRATLLALAALVLAQLHDMAILRMLDGRLAGAVMNFMFYPMIVVMLGLGFSLFVNWAALALAAINPLMLSATGWLGEFPAQLYSLLIWPTSLFVACISMAFAIGYHHRYLLERALEDASNSDPLTGVANRRHFHRLLQQEIARFQRLAQPCALLMLDIDHFKRINDNFGHPTGDRAIKALADACTQNSRAVDVVARLGGEEFAILMPAAEAEGAFHLAERIRAHLAAMPFASDEGQEIRWTVSMGIASLAPGGAQDTPAAALGEHLISRADAALYEAKNGGRNCVRAG